MLCSALLGCGRSAVEAPVKALSKPVLTARAIAARYGPITDEVADFILSGKADSFLDHERAEKRIYTLGEGKEKAEVAEYLVLGEPYKIEVRGRRYYNPLAEVADKQVAYVVYGLKQAGGIRIEDRRELGVLLEVIRNDSYKDYTDVAFRAVQLPSGRYSGRSVTRKGLGWFHGCTLGLYLHMADGSVVCLSGHASEGRFGWNDKRRYFRNTRVFELLQEIATKQGRKLLD